MSKKIYIALNGNATVGKDVIGRYLVHDYGFTRVSFADGVREALLALNPDINLIIAGKGYYPEEIWNQPLSEALKLRTWDQLKTQPDVRGLLQRMGTEVGRNLFGENVWVDLAHQKVKNLNRVIFTDTRFGNEAAYVKGLEGTTRIYQVFREGVGAVNSHVSEVLLDSAPCDGAIYNNGTIEELYAQVDKLMKELI